MKGLRTLRAELLKAATTCAERSVSSAYDCDRAPLLTAAVNALDVLHRTAPKRRGKRVGAAPAFDGVALPRVGEVWEFKATGARLTITEVRTGDVLAIGSWPSGSNADAFVQHSEWDRGEWRRVS